MPNSRHRHGKKQKIQLEINCQMIDHCEIVRPHRSSKKNEDGNIISELVVRAVRSTVMSLDIFQFRIIEVQSYLDSPLGFSEQLQSLPHKNNNQLNDFDLM